MVEDSRHVHVTFCIQQSGTFNLRYSDQKEQTFSYIAL